MTRNALLQRQSVLGPRQQLVLLPKMHNRQPRQCTSLAAVHLAVTRESRSALGCDCSALGRSAVVSTQKSILLTKMHMQTLRHCASLPQRTRLPQQRTWRSRCNALRRCKTAFGSRQQLILLPKIHNRQPRQCISLAAMHLAASAAHLAVTAVHLAATATRFYAASVQLRATLHLAATPAHSAAVQSSRHRRAFF